MCYIADNFKILDHSCIYSIILLNRNESTLFGLMEYLKKDMKEISITDLAGIIKARVSCAVNREQCVTGVSIDSRAVKDGDCFFAISGDKFDGHDYVSDAFVNGAVCAVVSKELSGGEFAGKCLIQVDDTIEALGAFAREYRRRAGFKVVAITGSAGKTTVRQIIHHVLGRHFKVHQSPKSFNNNIGLPLTLLGAEPDVQIVVAELGSNHPGEISYLTRIAAPDIAVVTNVYPAHLEGFGNLRTIVREKLSISEGLNSEGLLIINESLVKWLENYQLPITNNQVETFGKSDNSDYRVNDIVYEGLSSRFTIEDSGVHLPLAGPGNIENALAAWAVCSRFGVTIDKFASAVGTLPPVAMRAEPLQIGTLTVLNDCYNANPASMKNALDILDNIDPSGNRRLVFICGEMAELGGHSENLHIELGDLVSRTKIELLIAVGGPAKVAARAAQAGSKGKLQIKCFEDTLSACNNLHKLIKDYDIILVKGSRVAGLETVIDRLKEIFANSGIEKET